MRRALLLTLTISAGCGDDGDGGKRYDPSTLQAALNEARASQELFCIRVDGCYPKLVEADSCNVPTRLGKSGIQRDWPEVRLDPCWEVMFAHDAKAVLDFFECVSQVTRASADCWAICPTAEEGEDCGELYGNGRGKCSDALRPHIPIKTGQAYDACVDERAGRETSALPSDDE